MQKAGGGRCGSKMRIERHVPRDSSPSTVSQELANTIPKGAGRTTSLDEGSP